MMNRYLAITLGITLVLASCAGDFTPYNEVKSLRILALQAEPPNPRPGQTSVLRALVVSPDNQPITYEWSWCPAVGSANAGYPCLLDEQTLRGELNAVLVGAGDAVPTYDLGTATEALLAHAISPLVLKTACPRLIEESAGMLTEDCTQSFSVYLRLTVHTANETVTAIDKLAWQYRDDATPNQNPMVTSLGQVTRTGYDAFAKDGTTLLQRNQRVTVHADIPETAAQPYTMASGQAAREQLLFTWFVDAGDTEAVRTTFIDGEVTWEVATQNDWNLPTTDDAPNAAARLWLVVRDNRGGVAWHAAQVTLQEAP